MRKITIILPSLAGGGAERLHVNLANFWVKQGICVEFVLLRKEGDLIGAVENNINIIDLRINKIRKSIFPLRRYFINNKQDIILAAMWPLTSACVMAWRLAGKPGSLFLSDHNFLSLSVITELRFPRHLLSIIMKLTYPYASGLIAVSNGVKEDLCNLGNFAKSAVRVIYNPTAVGFPVSRESSEKIITLWGQGYDYHILSVGSLRAQKDHATLIKAFSYFRQHVNAKLTIVGEGPLRAELENLIIELGLQAVVSLPGFFSDPYPWFRSADLFVLSSRWEGFGNVIVEALECGLPVVSTNCKSGPSEILDDGRYGLLIAINDPMALALAMKQAFDKPNDPTAQNERSKNFSVQKISAEYLEYMFTDNFEKC